MFSCNKFLSWGVLAAALCCGQAATAAERWQLTFQFVGQQVELVDAVALGDNGRASNASTRHTTAPQQAQLQLRSGKGKLLRSHAFADPRLVRVPMLPGQASAHQQVLRDQGRFVVVTDALPTTSELTLQWPELQTSDGYSPAMQRQVSLQNFAQALQLQQ